MARKNETSQKAAMREMMRSNLKENGIGIKNGTDLNAVVRDMMSVILEGILAKNGMRNSAIQSVIYRNKDPDISRNGYSEKTMHTNYGDIDVAIPRDHNGEYEPQLIKKYQNIVTQDMEEKYFPFKNAISSNDGHHKEMDRTPSGLGEDSFPAGNLFILH